jgi:hypothetical protein
MFALLLYLLCDTVTGSLIYSRKILEIWCSIPHTTNGKIIVRAPGILSSVSPPHFLRDCDPVGSVHIIRVRPLASFRPRPKWRSKPSPTPLRDCTCCQIPIPRKTCTGRRADDRRTCELARGDRSPVEAAPCIAPVLLRAWLENPRIPDEAHHVHILYHFFIFL